MRLIELLLLIVAVPIAWLGALIIRIAFIVAPSLKEAFIRRLK